MLDIFLDKKKLSHFRALSILLTKTVDNLLVKLLMMSMVQRQNHLSSFCTFFRQQYYCNNFDNLAKYGHSILKIIRFSTHKGIFKLKNTH